MVLRCFPALTGITVAQHLDHYEGLTSTVRRHAADTTEAVGGGERVATKELVERFVVDGGAPDGS